MVRIEKEAFIGFYSIRKLLDAHKVSDSTQAATVELRWHPSIRTVDYLNWDKLAENYDLSVSHTETRDIRFVCNQFIHSYLFMIDGDTRLDGFYVTSDRDRHKKCYYISTTQTIALFRSVGNDYPANARLVRNPKNGQFQISQW